MNTHLTFKAFKTLEQLHLQRGLRRFSLLTISNALAIALAWPSAGYTQSQTPLSTGYPSTNQALPTDSSAGLSFTILQLQQQALKTSPLLAAIRQQADAAMGRQMIARAYPNPNIEVLTGTARARIPNSSGAGNASDFSLTQPIEWLDARGARIAASDAGLQAAYGSIKVFTNDLLSEVRLRSLQWLLHREEINALTDALNLLEQTRKRVSIRVETGESPRYELIKADAEVLTARARLDAARAQAEAARLRLSKLIGIELGESFALSAPRSLLSDLVAASELRLARVVDLNPEISQRRAEQEQAKLRLDEQTALRKPPVALRAQGMQDADLRTQQLGVQVTIPLFDQRRGQVREARAEFDRSKAFLEGRTYELKQQAAAAHAALKAAFTRVQALEGGVLKQAEAALSVAEAAYRFGERGILDTLDAQRVLRTVRSDLNAARLEAFSAATELDRISGVYVELIDANDANSASNPLTPQKSTITDHDNG